jgi:hypothetical protein
MSLLLFLIGAGSATRGLRLNVVHLDSDFGAGASDEDVEDRKRKRARAFTISARAAYAGVFTFAIFAILNFLLPLIFGS